MPTEPTDISTEPSQPVPSAFDIQAFLKSLTVMPGVYRMLGKNGEVLYVGKAKNLKNRVSSYFRGQASSLKTAALVERIHSIEVTVTHSETEALLLEQTLIKQLKPPYNILLRDDKSYPYIFISEHEFPRLAFHRGAKKEKGRYYGPYPSGLAVRESLSLLQKLFGVRQCEDPFFNNRTRPCLQFQIKRCSGPCVNQVSAEDYADDVRHTKMFLEGKNQEIMQEFVKKMEQAAEQLEFEQAGFYRDQIIALKHVQEQQYVTGEKGNVDVFAVVARPSATCVQAIFVRDGRVLGSKSFFPKVQGETDIAAILEEFIPQFYLGSESGRDIPQHIIVPVEFEGQDAVENALTQVTGFKVQFQRNVRTHRAAWLKLAQTNAEQNLVSYLANREHLLKRFEALQDALALAELPKRIECFDISHTQGEGTVASCVVFDLNGPVKADYRRFNIEHIQPGDDYAAMHQALTRRYTRLKNGEGKLPDILLIDGGKGQLAQAEAVLAELGVSGVLLIGVAKGPTRKAGLETLFVSGDSVGRDLPSDSSALHLIQQVRDEAHRFAILGHRNRRAKVRKESRLESIPGVGPKRRRALLTHFGGLQEIMRASADDIARVPGISAEMAEEIYHALHS